jgi:lipopolysaccharide transport system ATP-binding protein
MSGPIIQVENLSKRYILGHQRAKGDGFRHVVEEALHAPLRWMKNRRKEKRAEREEFWALRDLSFEVNRGDVVGIVGRNGAGKSTLLKILSRITEPTTGRIMLNGRVASLLEVGTGFHPELTGRENIFLNGAILGMSRVEIKRKFDEIVAFSEMERFLDTPVKRYSSGMYVRLAFAVAAHLEPEILVVDEVLAVGDGAFQNKCLAKIRSVASSGRTVLFVSHNLTTVSSLCKTGILLSRGELEFVGPAREAIQSYIRTDRTQSGIWKRKMPLPPRGAAFTDVRLLSQDGKESSEFDFREPIVLQITLQILEILDNAQIAVRVTNQEGVAVYTTCNTDEDRRYVPLAPGTSTYRVTLPSSFLSAGRYVLKINAHIPKQVSFDIIDDEIAFVVHDVGSHLQLLRDDRAGVVNPIIAWERAQ